MIRFCKGVATLDDLEQMRQMETALPAVNKMLRPTSQFLRKVADYFGGKWRAVVTESEAWQIWIGCYEFEKSEARRFLRDAEIAFWFGLNPFEIDDRQRAGMHYNLERMKAQQAIQNGTYDFRDFQGVYDLYMVAFDDDKRALKARAECLKTLIEESSNSNVR